MAERPSPHSANVQQRDYIIGIALLLVVVVLWTASNFITQDLFGSFSKPFLFVHHPSQASLGLHIILSLLQGHIPQHYFVHGLFNSLHNSLSFDETPKQKTSVLSYVDILFYSCLRSISQVSTTIRRRQQS